MLHAGAQLHRHVGLAPHQRREVDAHGGREHTESRRGACLPQAFGGGDQSLGRDAAAVETGTADLALLDEGHGGPELRGAQRRDVAGGAAAEHQELAHAGAISPASAVST